MRNVKKTLWLTENRDDVFRADGDDFKIKKIQNDTNFKPGNFISETDVKALIARKWTVTIAEGK
jgi:hypothetical protein